MEVIIFLLILALPRISALLLVLAPLAIAGALYYVCRRKAVDQKRAAFLSVVPVLVLLAWPLSGLLDLNQRCDRSVLSPSNSEKLGPVDVLLIDGPGMWWLSNEIDVERPEYGKDGKSGLYRIKEANPTNDKGPRKSFPETELRSQYKVTIKQPEPGSFLHRYLTFAAIVVEERTTGKIVASFLERAWGGGLAGYYIASLTKMSPFSASHRYLSCGYAGQDIGVFRGYSEERYDRYREADERLIKEIFILSAAQ